MVTVFECDSFLFIHILQWCLLMPLLYTVVVVVVVKNRNFKIKSNLFALLYFEARSSGTRTVAIRNNTISLITTNANLVIIKRKLLG